MKKIYVVLFAILVCEFNSIAQTPTDNWYFGNMAAIKFNGTTPTVVTNGGMFANEGCATMSDASGNLLFYTNGLTVWNKNHVVMTNGSGLLGGASATQAALIVPTPSNVNTYYIFTVDDQGGIDGLRYSIVDMTLGGGLGAVTSVKNVTLQTASMTEKLCGVKDPFNNRYWIAAHEFNSNKFVAYKLDNNGLQNPVYTSIGAVHSSTTMQNCYGQMKFNGCGNKLGVAIGYQKRMELFDFDVNSGIVSNPMSFPMPDNVYGLEFSSESKMLYVTTYDPILTLEQFDFSSNTFSTIAMTQTDVPAAAGLSLYALQIGIDKKIYVNQSNSNWLGVIKTPTATGAACNYTDMAIDLDPATVGKNAAQSLPAFLSSYFNTATCPNTSGIPELISSHQNLIFPNPSQNEFYFTGEVTNNIEIYDAIGRLIENFTVQNRQTISFGKNYPQGIYFVRIKDLEQVIKIIRE